MDKVFIVYSVDANDETMIYRVFSSYESALSYKDKMVASMLDSFERFFISEYEVFK